MDRLLAALRPFSRVLLALVAVVLLAVALDRALWHETPKTDFTVYSAAGRALLDGADPYDVANVRGWRYVYPPAFALLLAPVAALPAPLAVALFAMVSIAAAFHAVRLSHALSPDASTTAWATLLLAPAIVSGIARGQASVLVAWLVTAALHDGLKDRPLRAGLAVAAATALKLMPLPVAVLFVARRQGRALAALGFGLFALLAVLPASILGPARAAELSRRWILSVAVPALDAGGTRAASPLFEQLLDPGKPRNQSTEAVLTRWTGSGGWAGASRAAGIGAALLLLAGACAWRGRASAASLASAAVCFALLFSPIAETHYHAMLVAPLVVASGWPRHRVAARLAGAAAFATVCVPQLRALGGLWVATALLFVLLLLQAAGRREGRLEEEVSPDAV